MNLRNLHCHLIACAFLVTACATTVSSNMPARFANSILVNNAGMTLYTFDKDGPGTSTCIDQCAVNWPPFKVDSGSEGKMGGDYSIIMRADGSRQWAYMSKPLYLWSKDQKAGDKTGDGVNKIWHVVNEPEIPFGGRPY
ncbi:MAG: hypothetical protein JWN23_2848 [Rhodocyclales bacterium]|nr:hypothetical protein [Rhodocyclales bacterium]